MQSKPMKEMQLAIEQLAAARARGKAIKIKSLITKEMLLAVVRGFIERERMRTRKLKRSDRHPKRYHLAKNQPKPSAWD